MLDPMSPAPRPSWSNQGAWLIQLVGATVVAVVVLIVLLVIL